MYIQFQGNALNSLYFRWISRSNQADTCEPINATQGLPSGTYDPTLSPRRKIDNDVFGVTFVWR